MREIVVEVVNGINEIRTDCRRLPIVLRNVDIGPCSKLWEYDYISKKVGKNPVKVHVCEHSNMDFIKKNFVYKTLPIQDLISRIQNESQSNFFISPAEKYYLRSIGNDARGREVSNLKDHWPEIFEDLRIPPLFPEEQFFSSVLRITSSGIRLWTHYDIMDNILIQVRGRKEVVLWHPEDLSCMYMIGDKSSVLDIDNVDEKLFPLFENAAQYRCILEEGDILFIPALWLHNTHALTPGIAVNVFWKHLKSSLYDSNDAYGNKDLISGAKALTSVKAAVKNLDVLPTEYRNFYIRRMIEELKKSLTKS